MQFQHCEDCPSKFRSLHIMAELSCHAHAGCAKRRKPSTNIMIGGRKLKDVIEVNICLRGQCKLPCNCYLGSTSIVKLSSKPSLSSAMASASSECGAQAWALAWYWWPGPDFACS